MDESKSVRNGISAAPLCLSVTTNIQQTEIPLMVLSTLSTWWKKKYVDGSNRTVTAINNIV